MTHLALVKMYPIDLVFVGSSLDNVKKFPARIGCGQCCHASSIMYVFRHILP